MNWKKLTDTEKYELMWELYHQIKASGEKPTLHRLLPLLHKEAENAPEHLNSFGALMRLYERTIWGKELFDITDDFDLDVPDGKGYKIYATQRKYYNERGTTVPIVVEIDGVVRKIIKTGTEGEVALKHIQNAITYLRKSTPMGVK